MGNIYVFAAGETDFSTMGLVGALTPTQCIFRETGNGESIVRLTHPIDMYGRYKSLQRGNILSVPVPVRTTPEIQNGQFVTTVWTYKVKPLDQLTSKKQRTIYKRKKGSSKIKVLQPGEVVTVVQKLEDEEYKRWKVKSEYGTGWIDSPDSGYFGFEEVKEVVIADNSNAIEEVQSPWKVTPQYFRIFEEKLGISDVSISARHISYDLLYDITSYKSEEIVTLQTALDGILGNCYTDHEFEAYTNVDNQHAGLFYEGMNPINAILDPENGICEKYKVKLVRDNYDLYFLNDPGMNRGVRIEYKKNMLGINFTSSDDEVATLIIPVGKDKDGNKLYLSDVVSERYVASEHLDKYAIPHVYFLECENCNVGEDDGNGGKITVEIARARMLEQANKMLADGCDQYSISMSVEFINLGDTEEYKQFKDLENCFLYDYVTVWHSEHASINVNARIVSIEWDCLRERMNSVQIGSVGKSLVTNGISTWQIPSGISGSKIAPGTIGGNALGDKIISAYHLQAGSIQTEALAAGSIITDHMQAGSINADRIDADTLKAVVGEFYKLIVKDLEAGNITVDNLTADFIDAILITANAGKFDQATVDNLVANSMLLQHGNAGEVFIKNLQLIDAQVINATIKNCVIQGKDGKYYELDVNEDGNVTGKKVTVTEGELAAAVTSSGKKVILETDLVVDNLCAVDIKSRYALIDKITAASIDVAQLFAREAFITTLRTAKITSAGDSIEIIASKAAQSNVYTGDNPPANPAEGQLWVDTGVDPTVMRSWMGYDVATDREISSGELTADVVKFYPQTIRGDVKFVSEVECWQEGEGDPCIGGRGKNLLPTSWTDVWNGINYNRNSDGSVTMRGTATDRSVYAMYNFSFPLKLSAGEYVISVGAELPEGVSVRLEAYTAMNTWEGWQYTKIVDSANSYVVFETSDEYELMIYAEIAAGITVDLTIYPQVEAGNAPTDYVPYENIRPIAGRSFTNVSIRGKNLLQQRQFETLTTNGITFTQQADGGIAVTGTASTTAFCNLSFQNSMASSLFSLPNETFTVSGGKDSVSIMVYYFDESGAKVYMGASANGKSATLAGNGRPACIYLRVVAGYTIDTVIYPQLELGIETTDYEPYHGITKTCAFDSILYGKNLLKQRQFTSLTSNGISFVQQADGGIMVSGTASANVFCNLSFVSDATSATFSYPARALTASATEKIATLTIISQPKNMTVYTGSEAVFSVKATGEGLTYQWKYRYSENASWTDSNKDGAKTDTLRFNAENYHNGYDYCCVITDANGNSVTSENAKLTVSETALAITITQQPFDQSITEGGTAIFTAVADGEGLSYQWEHKTPTGTKWLTTTAGTGTTTNELSIEALAYRDGYIYHCVITDANGNSVTSESAKLTVKSKTLVLAFGGWDESGATVSKGTVSDGGSLTFEGNGELARIYLMVYSGATVSTVIYPKLEIGSEATSYEPYDEYYGSFNSTIYGGSYDWKKGIMTVTLENRAFNGTENWLIYSFNEYNLFRFFPSV